MTEPSLVIRPEPAHVNVFHDLTEIWKYRRLVKALVYREIRVRYRGSSFGLIWSLTSPLLQILVTTIAVGFFLGTGPHNLSEFIMCAFLPWTYFQTVLLDACATVYTYQGIIKKAYFPREIPVIAACCSNAMQLLSSLVIFVLYRWGIVFALHGWPGWPPIEVLWLPVILVLTFLFTLAAALIVTAYSFFYEDVKVLLNFGLSAVYYLIPIIYFAENIFYSPRVPAHLRSICYHLYLLNPLAWLITAYKQIFFGVVVISPPLMPVVYSARFDWRYLVISTISICTLLYLGMYNFCRLKWKFTERP
jgi:ABC-2 type transport system permease protein